MTIPFWKYHGSGNDFVIIDDRTSIFPTTLVPQICDRRKGIGADGVVLLQLSSSADYRMRIFNSDGGEAEMCGNGLRCLVDLVSRMGEEKSQLQIETMRGIFLCEKKEKISIFFQKPEILHWGISLMEQNVYVVDSGVPHAVIFVDDLDVIDLATFANVFRRHPLFGPRGVNVNIVSVMQEGVLKMRTFERGVEGETLSCGTGAAAVGFVASTVLGFSNPLSIVPPSKDPFSVQVEADRLELLGSASLVYEGQMHVQELL